MTRVVATTALGMALFSSIPAFSQELEGVPVSVRVIDENGAPIPTAWVRIPDTEGRRNVDPETGIWSARSLYTFDAEEIFFEKGMVIDFTVSAPGYSSFTAMYEVRRRRNEVIVQLETLEMVSEDLDESSIQWFKRTEAPRPDGRYSMDEEHGARLMSADDEAEVPANDTTEPTTSTEGADDGK